MLVRRARRIGAVAFPDADDDAIPNPFVRYRALFHVAPPGRSAAGSTTRSTSSWSSELDDAVARVDGRGFASRRSCARTSCRDRLGFAAAGGVWVKDETGNVSGSHKARHLMGLMIHLAVAERLGLIDAADRDARPLAIASCGNAALAAARRGPGGRAGRSRCSSRPTPTRWSSTRLKELEADAGRAPREPGRARRPDLPRAQAGARRAARSPFTCQGNENGLAIEGGLTLGYEMASQLRARGERRSTASSCRSAAARWPARCSRGFAEAHELGALDRRARACTPCRRAGAAPARARVSSWSRDGATRERVDGRTRRSRTRATHRSEFMWPWEEEPHSIAHGILDDETYDWLAVVRGMLETGGSPVVVDEATLREANDLGRETTGIDADHTGTVRAGRA